MTRLAFLSSTCPEWTFEQMADAIDQVRCDAELAAEAAGPCGVAPCLEVHDQHNNPADVAWIVEHAGSGNTGVVWHPSHHLRLRIAVDEAYSVLHPWLRHLHLQDWPKEGRRPA